MLAPDELVDRDSAWNVAYAWDERDADEGEAEDAHHQHHEDIRVFGGLKWFDLIPDGVEPQPRLARVAARLVHHSPLVAEQMLGFGAFCEQPAVAHEQQRLRVVGLEELSAGQQAA